MLSLRKNNTSPVALPSVKRNTELLRKTEWFSNGLKANLTFVPRLNKVRVVLHYSASCGAVFYAPSFNDAIQRILLKQNLR